MSVILFHSTYILLQLFKSFYTVLSISQCLWKYENYFLMKYHSCHSSTALKLIDTSACPHQYCSCVFHQVLCRFADTVNWVSCGLWSTGERNLDMVIQIRVPHTFCGALLKCCRDAGPIVQNRCDYAAAGTVLWADPTLCVFAFVVVCHQKLKHDGMQNVCWKWSGTVTYHFCTVGETSGVLIVVYSQMPFRVSVLLQSTLLYHQQAT